MFFIRFTVLVFILMVIFLGFLFLALSLKARRHQHTSCSSFDEHEPSCHSCGSASSEGNCSVK